MDARKDGCSVRVCEGSELGPVEGATLFVKLGIADGLSLLFPDGTTNTGILGSIECILGMFEDIEGVVDNMLVGSNSNTSV